MSGLLRGPTSDRFARSVMAVALGAAAMTAVMGLRSPSAVAAVIGPAAVQEPTSGMVTADALPTAQIDGVVWSQAVVGDTVYAGGKFANARPAGAAAGQSQVSRPNLLSYSLSTGTLSSFAPSLDAQVKTVVVSPDKSRVYVGGSFTTVNGVNRYRIAAFSTSTGALITSFAPAFDYTVDAIAATNTTVYVGGAFKKVGSTARLGLAAVSAANGALLSWAPSADATVTAMVLTPDGSRLIVGGNFQNINNSPAYGLGALDPNDGTLQPWSTNNPMRDAGAHAAITSITTDGHAVYVTGYVFGAGGNLEGTLAADPDTGRTIWIEDCHGDTYSAYGTADAVYTVSHAHYCSTVGGFPQTDQNWAINQRHALAFTPDVRGTLGHNKYGGYTDWFGQPAPAMYNWFPDLMVGTYTGQGQAAWNVTGSGNYVVMGGEFPKVNNTPQQGLVRFAVRPIAPGTQGPRVSVQPTLTAQSGPRVAVQWQTSWDRDDENLTYKVVRNGNSALPIFTTTVASQYWNRPTLSFTDTTVQPGTTYRYRITVTDPHGNSATGTDVTVTTSGTPPANQAPTASFSVSCAQLSCSFNGTGSSDPDGSIVSYAWAFGDGSTASGSTPVHVYGAAGTYSATLTVTDNAGASAATSKAVAVTVAPPATTVSDAFGRTATNGWGAADVGGPWTTGGVATNNFAVHDGVGTMTVPSAGRLATAYLDSLSSDSNTRVDVSFDKSATGSAYEYAYLICRNSGNSMYRARIKLLGTGVVQLSLTKVTAGNETVLATSTISGWTVTPGQFWRVRLQARGSSSVALAASLWPVGQAEPAAPQVSVTDSNAPLGAGGAGLAAYLSSSVTNAPVVAAFDNLATDG